MRRSMIFVAGLLAVSTTGAEAAVPIAATLYKNPQCACCDAYAEYLEQNGFKITIENTTDLTSIKKQAGVPEELAGCHTMLIENYVVEGLVPLDSLNRMLAERPEITGIALPGMPVGAPGMPGPKAGPFKIYTITNGEPAVYAVE